VATQDQERIFIDRYMVDYNGTEAAREAGYASPNNAAWRLLRTATVRDEIDRRIAEKRAANRITVATIEGMLLDIASVEPLDIWDEEGHVRKLTEMPPHARKAIKSIKRTVKEHPVTGIEEERIEVEMWDKKGAIELLGKYKKMFVDKIELEGTLKQKVAFSINGIIK
jgi:phage terminase small subunit